MRLGRLSRLKCALFFAIVLSPAILTTLPAFAETSAPAVLNTLGYINRKPLTSHTTDSFNSAGASTIVVFLSSHPSWDGRPVTIDGISDNAGNSWKISGRSHSMGGQFVYAAFGNLLRKWSHHERRTSTHSQLKQSCAAGVCMRSQSPAPISPPLPSTLQSIACRPARNQIEVSASPDHRAASYVVAGMGEK